MRKFAKYKNHKMHEIGSPSVYVSMRQLGDVVLSGDEIQVVDDVTGGDITSAVLARVLYNLCLEDPGVVPPGLVRDLILTTSRKKAA